MRLHRRLIALVPALRRRQAEREIQKELDLHLALDAEQNLRRGMSPEDASRAARAALGNVPLIKEDARAVWQWIWFDRLLQDVRLAWRLTGRARGFMAFCVLVPAFGIGVATTLYPVLYEVLIRPLPFNEPSRVVRVSEERPGAVAPTRRAMLSNLTFHAWLDEGVDTLAGLAGYELREHAVGLQATTIRARGVAVTHDLFSLLGVAPAFGRFFGRGDRVDVEGGSVILSDPFWRDALGARPDVVGSRLLVDGRFRTVIGVMPPGFYFPEREVLLWTLFDPPKPVPGDGNPRVTAFFGLGRLEPGTTAGRAAAEGTAVAQRLMQSALGRDLLFGVGGPPVVRVRTMAEESASDVRPALAILTLGVALLFLASCANVANLVVGRNLKRSRELAIRSTLGAGRPRLVRQLLTEHVLLAAASGVVGLALGWVLLGVVRSMVASYFPSVDHARIDLGTLGLALLLVLLTVVLCGLPPALQGARVQLARRLRGANAAGDMSLPGARRLRDLLLVIQAGFAVSLLVVAMLLARSFVRLTTVDPGYSPGDVLTIGIRVPGGFDASDERKRIMQAVLARVRAVPGVVAAGASNMMPLDNRAYLAGFPVRPIPEVQGRPTVATTLRYAVTPGYAEALRLRLVDGRLFDDRDPESELLKIIVNQEFARLYLPVDPVGTRLLWGDPSEAEIVGVVANVLKDGNDRLPQPEFYVPMATRDRLGADVLLAVRTDRHLDVLPRLIIEFVRDLAPAAATDVMPLADRLSLSVARPRFAAVVLGTFAVLSLLLSTAGLYGAVSFGVSGRLREIGVRSALGASRRSLILLIVRDGLRVTAIGLALGVLVAASLAGPLLEGVLFGIEPLDPVTLVAAPALLAVTATCACLVPTLRATRGEPAGVLRGE